MRYLIAMMFWLIPQLALAQSWEDRRLFENVTATQTLRILSSTDTSFFVPVIEQFLAKTPDAAVEYLVAGTSDIDRLFRENPDDYDVVISSAMDLQLKLANDGFALQLQDMDHPDWAQWRQSVFAFTSEPAAIVIDPAAFAEQPIPQTRQELIQAMRARPEVFRGKVGTYDVRSSGVGYLFATQDARASETFWRLMEVMGRLQTRLYCCSGDMIDDLSSGKLVVAYNVLGSYAAARQNQNDGLAIILPSDFPTTMMRTAMVSQETSNPALSTAFIRHLIALQSSPDRQSLLLPPLAAQRDSAELANIALEPALMTYLDALKRRNFLKEWENAVIQH